MIKTNKGIILEAIIKSGKKGMSMKKLYSDYSINPRQTRECVSQLLNDNLIKKTFCECGNTPIYKRIK